MNRTTKALLAYTLVSFFIPLSNGQADHVQKTYSVLPGKSIVIRNKNFHEVEIRSEYPVDVETASCHNEYTVQWVCKFDDPEDLFIRDLRQMPVLGTPRANAIVVSAR